MLPTPPDAPPDGHYVYSITVNGQIRYIGKGSGYRAWDHFPQIVRLFETSLMGKPNLKALFFHKMFVRNLARNKGEPLVVLVQIVFDNLTKEEAFDREARLIESLPIYGVDDAPNSAGLWNVGGRGMSVHARIKTAEDNHKDGIRNKSPSSKRARPTKTFRQDAKFLFGDFNSNSVKQ